ncbi:MAG: pvadh [Gemmataceae bacterium]|nr:pvadh [Gemmataceae bacterium]
MPRLPAPLAVLCLLFTAIPLLPADEPREGGGADRIVFGPTDWPWWRGPTRDGTAPPDQKPPLTWGEKENVVWQSPVPGRGHGAPAVVGDRVFLAAADHDTQSVLCLDRRTGKQLWHTVVHRGGVEIKGNTKSSQASSTPACDGTRVFINFLNAGAIYTTALGLDGKQLWQVKVTEYVLHQGFGSSPAVYKSLVIVSADNKGTGVIAGLDRATGKVVWTRERPKLPNYASPVILTAAGREQLILTGCDLVTALDPLTGEKIWETKGATTECVTSTVTDGKLVFTSGGYPKNHVSAVRADGSGQLVWENKARVYVPSMLFRAGYLYAVLDEGIPVCWKADTGAEVWRGRLGGTFTASPVLVGDYIYATNEAGKTSIFKATPDGFDVAAENKLGDEVMATPTICGGRIYMRVVVKKDGRREEVLYCLGPKG